jgi:hypothetical protein
MTCKLPPLSRWKKTPVMRQWRDQGGSHRRVMAEYTHGRVTIRAGEWGLYHVEVQRPNGTFVLEQDSGRPYHTIPMSPRRHVQGGYKLTPTSARTRSGFTRAADARAAVEQLSCETEGGLGRLRGRR